MTFQYCFDGSIKKVNNLSVSSPRTWGCFHVIEAVQTAVKVFPTHVGVFPRIFSRSWGIRGLPHARGGVSWSIFDKDGAKASSPRTWGCFSSYVQSLTGEQVFPTHVGVFLRIRRRCIQRTGLPHARGGVSDPMTCRCYNTMSSPRTWGCFSSRHSLSVATLVFPTHVGVFPPQPLSQRHYARLPHARGGVSDEGVTIEGVAKSSPRTWGCF